MPKNIILLSDGTGNSASKLFKTNVWRLYQALDLTTSDPDKPGQPKQLAYYDDGVGTASFLPLAIIGGAFGWGTKRIVLDLYTFLCRHYEQGDKVYAFGFSRGAFAVRMLSGLIANQGLVQAETESELRRLAAEAFRDYRENRYETYNGITILFRYIRNAFLWLWYFIRCQPHYDFTDNKPAPHIEFLGLWDTVAAYGLPFDEMTSAWDWNFPLAFPDKELSDIIDCVYHALAIDDERLTFHPEIYSENPADYGANSYHQRPLGNRLTQVWFAGMHSNIGGGYPDDALAEVPLNWIMNKAARLGLDFWPEERERLRQMACEFGKQYDSRKGTGGLYRYMPRNIEALTRGLLAPGQPPKIHESVFRRIQNDVRGYAPIGLPQNYQVVMTGRPRAAGPVRIKLETPLEAQDRMNRQQMVWNRVWWRRWVYFITITLFILLVIFPLIWHAASPDESPLHDNALGLISAGIGIVAGFMPGFLSPWLGAYQNHPAIFLTLVLLYALSIGCASHLQKGIFDSMRSVWDLLSAAKRPEDAPEPKGIVYRVRENKALLWISKAIKQVILPILFSAVIVMLLLRAVFQLVDATGFNCQMAQAVSQPGSDPASDFHTKDVCWNSQTDLVEAHKYRITLKLEDPWLDNHHIPAGANGVTRETLLMYLFAPLRRHLFEPYFKVIARIGRYGSSDTPLNLRQTEDGTLTVEITASKSGRLFLYVNDAVIPGPGSWQTFYRNNNGSATVAVEEKGDLNVWQKLR